MSILKKKLPNTGQGDNIAEPKTDSDLAFLLIFHRFSPLNCCIGVVLLLDKGDYPEYLQIVFVLINSVQLNIL